jgi:hypothetical protein
MELSISTILLPPALTTFAPRNEFQGSAQTPNQREELRKSERPPDPILDKGLPKPNVSRWDRGEGDSACFSRALYENSIETRGQHTDGFVLYKKTSSSLIVANGRRETPRVDGCVDKYRAAWDA